MFFGDKIDCSRYSYSVLFFKLNSSLDIASDAESEESVEEETVVSKVVEPKIADSDDHTITILYPDGTEKVYVSGETIEYSSKKYKNLLFKFTMMFKSWRKNVDDAKWSLIDNTNANFKTEFGDLIFTFSHDDCVLILKT